MYSSSPAVTSSYKDWANSCQASCSVMEKCLTAGQAQLWIMSCNVQTNTNLLLGLAG